MSHWYHQVQNKFVMRLCFLNRESQKLLSYINFSLLEPHIVKLVPTNHKRLPIQKIKVPHMFLAKWYDHADSYIHERHNVKKTYN